MTSFARLSGNNYRRRMFVLAVRPAPETATSIRATFYIKNQKLRSTVWLRVADRAHDAF